jgi:hypothetical protein
MTHYDDSFYDDQSAGSLGSAQKVVPLVYEMYRPKTVVDVGCGVGTWASVFESHGCEAVGVDGDYVPRDKILVKNYVPIDISERFSLDQRFDLAVCLEVAEHLSDARSWSFVFDLTRLSDVVLFSAATPGQGGTNHINEQPLEYWQKMFELYEYVMKDDVRPKIADLDGVEWWYKKNIVVFERS